MLRYFYDPLHKDDPVSQDLAVSDLSDGFRVWAILVPLIVIESYLYFFSVLKAYDRRVYQAHSKWRKGGRNPMEKESEKRRNYNYAVKKLELATTNEEN